MAHFTIIQINRTSSQGRLPPRFKLQICYFFEILAQDPVNNLARIKEGQTKYCSPIRRQPQPGSATPSRFGPSWLLNSKLNRFLSFQKKLNFIFLLLCSKLKKTQVGLIDEATSNHQPQHPGHLFLPTSLLRNIRIMVVF